MNRESSRDYSKEYLRDHIVGLSLPLYVLKDRVCDIGSKITLYKITEESDGEIVDKTYVNIEEDIFEVINIMSNNSSLKIKALDKYNNIVLWLHQGSYREDWIAVDNQTFLENSDGKALKTIENEENPKNQESHKNEGFDEVCSGVERPIEKEDIIIQNTLDNIKEFDILNTVKEETEEMREETEAMSNTITRRIVRIELIDNDRALEPEHSLVALFEDVVTDSDNNTTIQEVMIGCDMKSIIESHNQVRTSQVDLEILKRTGNRVNLQPIKLKDLTWIVK